MDTEDKHKNDATEEEYNISKKEVFFQIYNYSIGTEVIKKRDGREYKEGIEEKSDSGGILEK